MITVITVITTMITSYPIITVITIKITTIPIIIVIIPMITTMITPLPMIIPLTVIPRYWCPCLPPKEPLSTRIPRTGGGREAGHRTHSTR